MVSVRPRAPASYVALPGRDEPTTVAAVREAGPAAVPKPHFLDRGREAVRASHYSRAPRSVSPLDQAILLLPHLAAPRGISRPACQDVFCNVANTRVLGDLGRVSFAALYRTTHPDNAVQERSSYAAYASVISHTVGSGERGFNGQRPNGRGPSSG